MSMTFKPQIPFLNQQPRSGPRHTDNLSVWAFPVRSDTTDSKCD